MPSINLSSDIMKARFCAFGITLPSVVPAAGSGPVMAGSRFAGLQQASQANRPAIQASTGRLAALPRGTSGGAAQAPTGTPMMAPPALFKAASNDARDCEFQRSMHQELDAFFNIISKALVFGFDMWRLQARMEGVQVMAITAVGGRVVGPMVDKLMQQSPGMQGLSNWSAALSEGVSGGFANQWKRFNDTTTVPGLPWYPLFAAFPGPMAPPTPNIPMPVATLLQNLSLILPAQLKAEMRRSAPSETPYAEEVFTAVAESLSPVIMAWRGSQQVMNVLGRGPVPAFAPPYVPVGPVVGGDIISVPGHFMV